MLNKHGTVPAHVTNNQTKSNLCATSTPPSFSQKTKNLSKLNRTQGGYLGDC